jgi:hypothetical protein
VAEGPTPTTLAHHIMNKIQTTRERKSRFCMRFMPVEQTCFASKDELAEKVAPLIAKHFPAGDDVTPVKVWREFTSAVWAAGWLGSMPGFERSVRASKKGACGLCCCKAPPAGVERNSGLCLVECGGPQAVSTDVGGVRPRRQFSVLYECRASGPFDRSEMIDVVAKQVPKVSFLGDAESSLGDAKSSLGDAKSSLGEA